MFSVVIDYDGQSYQYNHAQRKIALRQFEEYKKRPKTFSVSIVHTTHKVDEVIEFWERS